MQRLNPQDEYFLDSDTPAAPTHIGGLEVLRLPKGAGRDYLQKMYGQLLKAPVRAEPFNFRLATIEPEEAKAANASWIRPAPKKKNKPKPVRAWEIVDGINVEEHLYLHALPKPGGERELGELVARLHVNRLDRSRPLWEMHLIEGLEGGRYALYSKLHHSQFDGKRGMVLSRYVRSSKESTRGLPPMWAVKLDQAKGDGPEAGKAAPAASGLKSLASWGKALSSMRQARNNSAGAGVIAPYSAPQSIFNGVLTARRRLGTQSLSITRMKALGAAVEGGATVNEILLAVCGGALRRYMLDNNAVPEQPLIAACPVAQARKDEASAGSAVGQMLVSLATHVADPKERLLAVVASGRANKGLMKDLDADAYAHYTELSMMPQVLAAKTGYGHKVLNANLVISNVPGFREVQYTNGARLEAMYSASMLLAGQALNITVCNFGDNLDMGIMACPDLCPSPQKIAVYAGEELAILERAMGLKTVRPSAPRKAAVAKKAPTSKKRVARKAGAAKPKTTPTPTRRALAAAPVKAKVKPKVKATAKVKPKAKAKAKAKAAKKPAARRASAAVPRKKAAKR